MKTTYLTTLNLAFNPFSRTSKVPRLFLGLLPPAAYKTIQMKQSQLPRSSTSPSFLELGFKDGKKLRYEWTEEDLQAGKLDKDGKVKQVVKLDDIVTEVDRLARIQGRKEELAG
jgi:39S ribosomal protein L53/MRP-L53